MNIPTHFRAFALFLLPTFFAVLLAGCGGGHSITVYEPVNESRSDLVNAKTTCEAQVIRQIAPIQAQQEAQAAERRLNWRSWRPWSPWPR